MKLLIKKIFNNNNIIKIRNSIGLKKLYLDIKNLQNVSISDSFLWRTDKTFETTIKFTNILKHFDEDELSKTSIIFFSKNNKLIKHLDISNLNINNEIIINKEFLNGMEDYGVFYIFHSSKKKFEKNILISNRCYVGYSYKKNLYSFVHGNTLAKYTKICENEKISTDIVKTSYLLNKRYKIQKIIEGYDKNELFFCNPTSQIIKFKVNGSFKKLNKGQSVIIDVTNFKIVSIISNCMFLRPILFNYKNDYLDVHHC